jgi:hypothetical protein
VKSSKYKIAFVLISFLCFSSIESSVKVYSTNCHQTFHFFFLSEGSPTFWIGEDLGGECNYSNLLHIGVNNSTVSFSQSRLEKLNSWGNIPKLKSLFRVCDEHPSELKDKVWENKDLKIIPPEYDSLLAEEFSEHIRHGGSNAYSWINLKGDDGIVLPKIEGIKTDLIFSYKTGLYINYEISEVHYFPNSYILVFTHQPRKAVGLDTMHGFLIFKIE